MALNNIHRLLDCDIILGGYVGSYAGERIQDIWDKVSERDTFEEKESYPKERKKKCPIFPCLSS